ncbi:NAD(P)/FAD-dependent oxidoreductase [Trinickia caryophylli]|uniref:NADPH-dependent 2,4-dienoyl-CoA reductase, sulfur reductase n=1 Tax=Trinickia caryophylli TaxID=28094 RepID=A0A1X7D2K7_TRICW|nr:NAD(P)/FAD-dependent oxidoreductase [Trinickia caryophylli]PMS12802.1 FAD/NAD(P)-binding oxidoreductase [Trinickia caryophylli]TRX15221.1 FAD/NAD(P)-binding oxidoreductase [Trinickia caryophylli]WQE15093.1 NAD(P)/FAD-dependent oxidoreductase [Trinickia caryophylli]SMF07370.1 NADPH-dependent 2,4-dienoyl-CoA reductase, sulfur reductase [Trinickia caryophylli]GLU31172.1 (2Fe-2S)-binding protein [Trinickia caryophylli]
MAARIVVVGAGPAGVRAAEAFVEHGVRPVVVDESRRDGGQVYRRQDDRFTRSYATLYGTEAPRAARIHGAFDALKARIDYLPETLSWNVSPGELHLIAGGTCHRALGFDALVICGGATDRIVPVKGWHFSGVYSLGGAQVALKSQGCAIGSRVVLMGSGPLLYLLAAQYVKAGAGLAAVLDTSPAARRLRALPALAAVPAALLKGLALVRTLRRAGVTIHRGVRPIEIVGTPEDGVGGVKAELADGTALELACDAVALGHHLRPETQLADLAGCEFVFDEAARQWLPRIDEDGRSTVPGIYLAGDGARVLGADAAEASGRLAALAALADRGVSVEGREALRRRLARYARFAAGLRQAFPWPADHAAALADDAIVCRCEAIRAGELRRIVEATGAHEANRAKAFSRVGMGRCQGRYCGHAAAEIIAATAGVPLQEVGRLRTQSPVKPMPMAIVEDSET